MEGDKAKKGANELVKLKEEEIIQYANDNKEVIFTYLKMQQELERLRSQAIDVRMKQVPLLLKLSNKP